MCALVARLSSLLGDRFDDIKPIGSRTVSSLVVSAIRIQDSLPVVLKYVEGPNGEHEANMLRENEHPSIIQLLDFITLDGGSCLVLPLAPLGDLGTFMNSRRFSFLDDNSPAGWRSIVRQILLPLQFLHSKGIVHNDIKLQNYVVFGTKTQPIIKLIDLALSRQNDTPSLIGTFEYTSPEKFDRKMSTQKSDIWSVGVTVYVAFTGQELFRVRKCNRKHRNALIVKKVQSANVVFNPTFWVEYPEAEELIRGILISDPELRPSATNLLAHPILNSEVSR
jgi:serine/threonine protein kinase